MRVNDVFYVHASAGIQRHNECVVHSFGPVGPAVQHLPKHNPVASLRQQQGNLCYAAACTWAIPAVLAYLVHR